MRKEFVLAICCLTVGACIVFSVGVYGALRKSEVDKPGEDTEISVSSAAFDKDSEISQEEPASEVENVIITDPSDLVVSTEESIRTYVPDYMKAVIDDPLYPSVHAILVNLYGVDSPIDGYCEQFDDNGCLNGYAMYSDSIEMDFNIELGDNRPYTSFTIVDSASGHYASVTDSGVYTSQTATETVSVDEFLSKGWE